MNSQLRLSDLSISRQAVLRLCQSIDYGEVSNLHILEGEPVFDPPPTLLLDIRLDAGADGRWEAGLADFVLCKEVRRFLGSLDQLRTGTIQRIEVRAGIPRRLFIEAKIKEFDV